MNLRYRVDLSQEERAALTAMIGGGTGAVRRIKRAQILLAADAGPCDDVIASTVAVGGRRSPAPSALSSRRAWRRR